MRASQLFFPTQREIPKDAELASHQLLLRGGFIRNLAAGVYSYLPLGWRVHEKIAQIVREEANAFGGQELHMPVLVPKELLDETGRSKVPVLFRLKDRNERDFFLGFTHEEVVTDIVRGAISSWKQLPVYLYQIQTKERDEPRPRGGLIRAREFTMFDGYSFDYSEEMLDTIYKANYRAYGRVFERCGLQYLAVEADPGAIGGTENHEFMVLTPGGEDTVLRCDSCSYAANAERAEVPEEPAGGPKEAPAPMEVVATPDAHTVEQVCSFLNVSPQQLIKTIICVANGKPVAALVRGDRELNLPKFARVLGASDLELADAATVERVTRAPVGFAGPVGLASEVPIYADNELKQGANYVVGANQADAHIVNVTPDHDFTVGTWADIRTAIAGDRCPRCAEGHLTEARGIEVGHIFKLGVKYSKDMGALYQNEAGEKLPIIMGCYGLGVSRTMAAAVEAHHDENGIVWPISIAPFEVAVLVANVRDEAQVAAAGALYEALQTQGVEALLDDREERAGVKFKDMDLIGIPVQVVVGRGVAEGTVEVGLRREGGSRQTVPIDQAVESIASLVASERARLQPA
ncbi:MAG TPA: proline--tRNA ligase [Chthonomonadaceae bacterium]|nr:proline--tRNA ligase [Chthonomonadaceae bacterium]